MPKTQLKKDFISVVIPAHNEEDVIAKAINSVLKSTYKKYEIIVVNDGSTDRTREIAEEFVKKHPRKIKLLNYEQGHSPAFARNRGAENAKGDILFFLDADDWVREDTLENIVKAFRKYKGVDFIVGVREVFMPKNFKRIFLYYWAAARKIDIREDMIKIRAPCCPYIMKTKKFFEVDKFNEKLYYNEDEQFRLNLIKLNISKLLTNKIHFYTDMGCQKKDFLRRCKNTAKRTASDMRNFLKILITFLMSFLAFPIFFLVSFSYVSLKSRDILISFFAPFLYSMKKTLDMCYFLTIELQKVK